MIVTHIGEIGERATEGKWNPRFPHTRYLCKRLMELELGLMKRQIYQMPPRHGKTTTIANILPFHYLTLFPQREIIYVSHSADFASEQGERLRSMIEDSGSAFGIGVSNASRAKNDFDIVDEKGKLTGGSVRCFGITSGIHGRGCSLLILDDLFKNVTEALSPTVRDSVWRTYTSSLHTRLTPGGSVVAIGTPLHVDDWFGRVAAAESDGGEKFDWIKLHAIAQAGDAMGRAEGEPLWPAGGWTVDELEAKKNSLTVSGNYRDWKAQYELEPITGDGISEWPDRYFDDLLKAYVYKDFWTNVLAIDTSKGAKAQKKGDFQAFAFLEADKGGHIRARCELHRLDVNGIRAKAVELYEAYRPVAVVVETNGAGYALLEDLWEARVPAIGRYHPPGENKSIRITQRIGRTLEMGILHFDNTPANKLVVQQARLFPHGKYDDGLDAVEMGLEFINQIKMPKHLRNVKYQVKIAPKVSRT
jgi:phage terminase large subunit-like protein